MIEAFLCQLSNLHLIVLRIEQLPLVLLHFYPQQLHLVRQSLDLNRLKDDYEVDIVS